MKSELEYLKLALAEWCKAHRYNAELPLSGKDVLAVLEVADRFRAADRKALETAAG